MFLYLAFSLASSITRYHDAAGARYHSDRQALDPQSLMQNVSVANASMKPYRKGNSEKIFNWILNINGGKHRYSCQQYSIFLWDALCMALPFVTAFIS